ncbi:multicopper oxidase domain-containing protein [Streptomyces fuscichromogenes]|nr:multicopper oxidase domain-containing protein [Streptomyces fuscichromogenes]
MAKSWALSGRTPGKEIRPAVGDTLAAELSDQLPDKTTTSIHWHGIALRAGTDGVPPVRRGDRVRCPRAFPSRAGPCAVRRVRRVTSGRRSARAPQAGPRWH